MENEANMNMTIETASGDIYKSADGAESLSEEEVDVVGASAADGNKGIDVNLCQRITSNGLAVKSMTRLKRENNELDSCQRNVKDCLEISSTAIVRKESKQHTRTSSGSEGNLTVHVCTHEGCSKVFSRPSRLVQHERTHTGERPYACPSAGCFQTYTRQQHLKRHLEIGHQDKSDEKLKCDECEKVFSNVYSLKKHHYRYHVRNMFKCESCELTFRKQQHLRTHSYVHTGVKPYKCNFPECDVRCETPSRLKRHSMIHEKNRYACPQESCQETFDQYKELQHHLSTNHPKACDICGRTFRQLRQVKVHRMTHENVQVAYFCPFVACDKHFYKEENLKAHIATKHEQSRIYECGVCSKRLSTKQKLMQHTKTHSPSYKRNYKSNKPRKPRKDKGVLRRDLARLLSNYCSDEECMDINDLDASQNETPIKSRCLDNLDPREEIMSPVTKEMNNASECQTGIEANKTHELSKCQ
ncbi:transcription factor IIIA [Procambarus clarkii]|uniref:transcription factor IIIA n=1 Tax=Procambarus clarkii TaxID=6728 RepID=UPI001E671578|nr:transcription factor IIIA-like [Procambarus clarkii]XP_045606829.1 transcription factor IIIA-like [Procambarus clarkii]